MGMFREYVSLCQTKEEFVLSIRELLDDPLWTSASYQKIRREFALTHTWENSIGKLGDAFFSLKKIYQKVGV
jgi:hypothetical protein